MRQQKVPNRDTYEMNDFEWFQWHSFLNERLNSTTHLGYIVIRVPKFNIMINATNFFLNWYDTWKSFFSVNSKDTN